MGGRQVEGVQSLDDRHIIKALCVQCKAAYCSFRGLLIFGVCLIATKLVQIPIYTILFCTLHRFEMEPWYLNTQLERQFTRETSMGKRVTLWHGYIPVLMVHQFIICFHACIETVDTFCPGPCYHNQQKKASLSKGKCKTSK